MWNSVCFATLCKWLKVFRRKSMKNIVIFKNGKGARGSRAKLIKRGNKRVLIQFTKHDFNTGKDVIATEWFKLFIPIYVQNKKAHKHNNKRNNAMYYHEETNEFYSDFYQSEEFKSNVKKYFSAEYYDKLFVAI